MRILGVPAFRNRAANPYTALLYSAVQRAGCAVEEASLWSVLRAGHDVVHIHWPEHLFSAPASPRALAQALLFAAAVGALRARGAKVVWTIHNLAAHEPWHPRLEATMWRWFVDRVDGYIALTSGGRAAALARFPRLAERPGFVIPHGLYRGEYPDWIDRAAARRLLDLPARAAVLGFFGTVRAYKNVPHLIEVFRSVAEESWRLVVAGKPSDHALATHLRALQGDDRRIRLDLGHVANDRVQVYVRAADLLVVPYRDVLNSGSALLALSFGRPVLVPALGAMAELREAAGAEWVRTYEGELTARVLVEAMEWARATPRGDAPVLRDLDWPAIARQTLLAYAAIARCAPAVPRVGSRSGATS